MERKRDKDRNRKTEKYRNIHRKTETGIVTGTGLPLKARLASITLMM